MKEFLTPDRARCRGATTMVSEAVTGINIAIVTPVYNDWTSFRLLVLDLAQSLSNRNCTIEIIAVDDCSSECAPEKIAAKYPIKKITTLQLAANMGHQRAIAIGLMSIADRADIDYVAVMD